ncbi:MAG: hypothetical protein ABID09_04125 [Candidatus Omnitrophota bacterium]
MIGRRIKQFRRKGRTLLAIWNFCEYALLRACMTFVNLFPIDISTFIARGVGTITFFGSPGRRRVAIQNITTAFGDTRSDYEKRRIALESFRHIAVSIMEFFRLPKAVKVAEKNVTIKNGSYLDSAVAKGKGTVIVMSHLGSWEYMAFLTKLKGHAPTILGKVVRNPYVYEWVKSLRQKAGLEHKDRDMGIKWIFKEMRQNRIVGIVIDQWAGNYGEWIDFFGVKTSTTSFPARLAKKTGCALVAAFGCIRVSSGKYEIHLQSEINFNKDDSNWVENTTRELNTLLEREIRAFPEQWMWTHKRWKNKRHTNPDGSSAQKLA